MQFMPKMYTTNFRKNFHKYKKKFNYFYDTNS